MKIPSRSAEPWPRGLSTVATYCCYVQHYPVDSCLFSPQPHARTDKSLTGSWAQFLPSKLLLNAVASCHVGHLSSPSSLTYLIQQHWQGSWLHRQSNRKRSHELLSELWSLLNLYGPQPSNLYSCKVYKDTMGINNLKFKYVPSSGILPQNFFIQGTCIIKL